MGAHKRLKAYSLENFALLKDTLSAVDEIVVTPNTLSEASNLLRQIADPAKSQIAAVFAAFINRPNEIYVSSATASRRVEFLRLGLADNALLEIGASEVVLLSADLDLCMAAESAGYKAINFNHLRDGLGAT